MENNVPVSGNTYNVTIEHWNTKTRKTIVLVKVEEDDCDWRFPDDNSELSYDWNVISWEPI